MSRMANDAGKAKPVPFYGTIQRRRRREISQCGARGAGAFMTQFLLKSCAAILLAALQPVTSANAALISFAFDPVQFPDTVLGTTSDRTITINMGFDALIVIDSVELSGLTDAQFTLGNTSCTSISVLSPCHFTGHFSPTALGPQTSEIVATYFGKNGLTGDPTTGSITGHLAGNGISDAAVAQTPLPAALPLFAAGLGVMGLMAWRRRRPTGAAATS